MSEQKQKKAPLYEALENFRKKRIVPFDVPEHMRGLNLYKLSFRVYIANTFTTLIDRFTSDAFKGFIKLIKFEPAGKRPAQSIIWTLKYPKQKEKT